MKSPAAVLCALLIVASTAEARPVDDSEFLDKMKLMSRAPGLSGGTVTPFATAQSGTTFYGGTVWAADSARWEALEDSVWTFDSGVGSHFNHSDPSVNPYKDPTLHAFMEGWVGFDKTYSEVTYFRRVTEGDPRWADSVCVGSAAGLPPAPGDSLNTASYWCGVFPEEAEELCYLAGQGYGNSWSLCIGKTFAYSSGTVTLEFDYRVESEMGFDFAQVLVDSGAAEHNRYPTAQYDGHEYGHESLTLVAGQELPLNGGPITVRFCFISDSVWSDEDGLVATSCGAFAVDNVKLSGGIEDGPATFEMDEDGWELLPAPVGNGEEWSNIVALEDLPPILTPCDCAVEDSVLVFENLVEGGHNEWTDNLAASPWIDLGPDGYANQAPGKIFQYDIYAELPLLNYNFAQFHVQWYPDVCEQTGTVVVSPWTSNGFVFYFGGIPSCTSPQGPPDQLDFSAFIPPGATQIRLGVGVISYCRFYAGCTGVSNSTPWFDNVALGVYGSVDAPTIDLWTTDRPQDSFPQNGTLTWNAPGRIDCNNVSGASSPEQFTSLGDTLVVRGAQGGAEVFVEFSVHAGGGVDSTGLAEFLGSVTFVETREGHDWYQAQMDTAESGDGGPVDGIWMTARIEGSPGFTGTDTDRDPFDLDPNYRDTRLQNDIFPDDLLTPGSHLSLFYKTRYVGGTSWFVLPDTSGGNFLSMDVLPSSFSASQEFNCLLYVDRYQGRWHRRETSAGAEPFIRNALRNILGTGGGSFEGDFFDTYNVRAPSSQQASFGRPLNTQYGASLNQVLGYRAIIWNSGSLPNFNLSREDADILIPWLTLLAFDFNNLYLSGDGLVRSAILESQNEPSARRLIEDLAGVQYTCDTYRDLNCPPGKVEDRTVCVNLDPVLGAKVAGNPGRVSPHLGQGNDCPELRSFDVLRAYPSPNFGVATPDEVYSTPVATSGPDHHASVANDAADSGSLNYRIVTDGISVHTRRKAAECTFEGDATAVTERLTEVLSFLGYAEAAMCADRIIGGVPEFGEPGPVTTLRGLYPNPLTAGEPGRIQFSLAEDGTVEIDIFDLQGRLVKTLGAWEARKGSNEAEWDGRDAGGRLVASGVYFYRLRTTGAEFTRKLVILRR